MNQRNLENNVLPIDEIKKCTELFDLIKTLVEKGELECSEGIVTLSSVQRGQLDRIACETTTKSETRQKFSAEMLNLFNLIGDLNEYSIIEYNNGQIHLTTRQQRALLKKYSFRHNQEVRPIKPSHASIEGLHAVYTLKTPVEDK